MLNLKIDIMNASVNFLSKELKAYWANKENIVPIKKDYAVWWLKNRYANVTPSLKECLNAYYLAYGKN
jgi:hypothetical protein